MRYFFNLIFYFACRYIYIIKEKKNDVEISAKNKIF